MRIKTTKISSLNISLDKVKKKVDYCMKRLHFLAFVFFQLFALKKVKRIFQYNNFFYSACLKINSKTTFNIPSLNAGSQAQPTSLE